MESTKYETMYIIRPNIDEEAKTALIGCFDTILKDNGTEVIGSEGWEKYRLAYEISGYREGVYHIIKVSPPSLVNAINEFDRFAKINDDIIRHMIVREEI